jgi:hypothetical protein
MGFPITWSTAAGAAEAYHRSGHVHGWWALGLAAAGGAVGAATALRAWLREPPVISEWALRFREDVVSLTGPYLAGFERRHGRAPGENTVSLARQEENAELLRQEFDARLPTAIGQFFSAVAEVRLPDVHIGYFIGPPSAIVATHRDRRPRCAEIDGRVRDVLVFGANGSGSQYAVTLSGDGRVHDGRVYELPPGAMDGGCHRGPAVAVAGGFEEFLGQIQQRLREVVAS